MNDAATNDGNDGAGRKIIVVDYDGSLHDGWQRQGHDPNTIQERLERALGQVADEPVVVFGAGRTDRGVHAINMTAHFDSHAIRSLDAWRMGGNSNLPPSIRIKRVMDAPSGFHARSSATGRSYRYVLLEDPIMSPFLRGRVGMVRGRLDLDRIREAVPVLLGERDFSSFRASECQSPSPVKTLRSIRVRRSREAVVFDFEASGFLHRMVRNLMGALVRIGQGVMSARELELVLLARDRTAAPPTFMGDGLYFYGASYDGFPQMAKLEPPAWFWGEGDDDCEARDDHGQESRSPGDSA